MLTNNVDYHDLGADHFTRRNPDVSYGGSANGQTPSAAASGSTHPTDPQGQADAEPHHSFSSQTGCARLYAPGRALGYLDGVDAGLDRVSRTPQPALLKDGGRLASSLGTAGEGPGRFSFNVIGKSRPGNVQRLAKLRDNGTLRVHIQPQYPPGEAGEAVQAPTTHHTQSNCSCGCPFANSAAISRRPGPGGFVRLPTWLSRR